MQLPFLPYGRHSIDEADVAAVVAALRRDYLTTLAAVAAFERALAVRLGAPHAAAVCNGTAALHAACHVAGLGPGDEALVPAITFLATANCVRYVGAEPVFVDVDPISGLMTSDSVKRALGPRTKAILPVHLRGRPVDMAPLVALAEQRGLLLIEDAAHALGASYGGAPVGSGRYAAMATFSFHPVKHATTGEGGAVTTADPALHERLLRFRNHGMVRAPAALERPSPGPWYYEQQELGHNLRITDLQCALGSSQLGRLSIFLERRRTLAARYDRLLADLHGVTPTDGPRAAAGHAYHLYAVRIDFGGLRRPRAAVMTGLRELGIGTQVHYIPVPHQPYYRARGWRAEQLPGAWDYYEHTLSLPLYPSMADTDVDRVVEALAQVLR